MGEHQRFLKALRNLSFGETCGEVANNVFGFFFTGLVKGVVVGVSYMIATDLVLFYRVETAAVVPLNVLPFLLLDGRRLVRTGWLGVCCGGVGVYASAAWPSAVMAAMISSSCLASAGVGVTLVAAAGSSASTCSISSSEAGGVC